LTGSGNEEQLARGPAAFHVDMGARRIVERVNAAYFDPQRPFNNPLE
jgi:hypothetical protein